MQAATRAHAALELARRRLRDSRCRRGRTSAAASAVALMCAATLAAALAAFFFSFFFLFFSALRVETCDSVSVSVAESMPEPPCVCSLSLSAPFISLAASASQARDDTERAQRRGATRRRERTAHRRASGVSPQVRAERGPGSAVRYLAPLVANHKTPRGPRSTGHGPRSGRLTSASNTKTNREILRVPYKQTTCHFYLNA